jgi:hypothetical protein
MRWVGSIVAICNGGVFVELESILTEKIRSNPKFTSDMAKLFEIDAKVAEKLRSNLPSQPAQLDDKDFLSSGASKVGVDVEWFRALAAMVRMVSSSIAASELNVEEVTKALRNKYAPNSPDSSLDLVSKLITPNSEEIAGSKAVSAFAFGDTFIGSEFTPLIVPSEDESLPNVGGNLQISYLSPSNHRRVLSLNLSLWELKDFIGELTNFARRLENLNTK